MEVDYFLACYRSLLPLARLFPNLEYLDLGGGFGVPDDEEMDFSGIVNGRGFDFGAYGRTVTDLLSGFSKELGKPVRLVLEPGRIVGASCGYFACTVTDIKIRGGKQLIGVNASSAQFPRPLFYPEEARHPLRLIRDGRIVSAQVRLSAVFGCSTYSRDFLGRDLMLPDAGIGDVLLFGHAGAYCNAAHTSFLGFPRPREVFV
jgi:diaminopimelate decarboxylase